MERLTTTIPTVKDNTSVQAALEKLGAYEDAEESGRLIRIPEEVYYIRQGRVCKGEVEEVTYKHLWVEEGQNYELHYLIETGGGGSSFRGVEGVNVFRDEEEARLKCYNL